LGFRQAVREATAGDTLTNERLDMMMKAHAASWDNTATRAISS
jgi:hypothetical protein